MIGAIAAHAVITTSGDVVHTLTIPSGTVASNLTGFVTRVDLSHLSNDWWTATSSDLGNVRVKQAGTVIPFDVVWYDRTAKTGELFFKANLNTGSDNVFTIETVTGATALAATDGNGRNAVWGDYDAVVLPAAELINRVNGNAVTLTGTAPMYGIVSRSPNTGLHQGVAYNADDDTFIGIGTDELVLYARDYTELARETTPLADSGISGVVHLGDGCIVDGELFVCADDYPSTTIQHVAVYDAATLTYLRSYNVVSVGFQIASICHDGTHFYTVGYNAGTNVATSIQKWDEDWNHVATLTTASITNKQGITLHDGYFWITSGNTERIYRVNLDGSGATIAVEIPLPDDGVSQEPEGITSDGTDLFLLYDHGNNEYIYRLTEQGDTSHGYHFDTRNHLKLTGLPKRTAWTMGATASLGRDTIGTRNHTLLSYSTNSSSTANQAVLVADEISGSPDRFGIWNSTDAWLYDTSAEVAVVTPQRLHHTQNGTTDRKIWRAGVSRATDSGVAQRPASTGDTFYVGVNNTGATESWYGWINRAYLRNGVLSADWINAEYVSWETPASFYAIT